MYVRCMSADLLGGRSGALVGALYSLLNSSITVAPSSRTIRS